VIRFLYFLLCVFATLREKFNPDSTTPKFFGQKVLNYVCKAENTNTASDYFQRYRYSIIIWDSALGNTRTNRIEGF